MQSIDDNAIATSVAATGEGVAGAPLIFRGNRGPKGRRKNWRPPPSLMSRSGSGLKQETMQSTILTQLFAVHKDEEDVSQENYINCQTFTYILWR